MYNSRTNNTRSVNPTVFGASGFYNAESEATLTAQKNIADAQKNLASAKTHLGIVQANYDQTNVQFNAAREQAQACGSARDQKNTNSGKENACPLAKYNSLKAKWNSLSEQLTQQQAALVSATKAVTTANENLISAQAAADKIKNADPQYAIQQQQIVAQQNIAQAQTNAQLQTQQAQIAADSSQKRNTLFVFGGLALVTFIGLIIYFGKSKSHPSIG